MAQYSMSTFVLLYISYFLYIADAPMTINFARFVIPQICLYYLYILYFRILFFLLYFWPFFEECCCVLYISQLCVYSAVLLYFEKTKPRLISISPHFCTFKDKIKVGFQSRHMQTFNSISPQKIPCLGLSSDERSMVKNSGDNYFGCSQSR